ncbi:hypothetical protein TNCV_4878331 [Trichonephila clavipes]|nr:hypothetical protein TNCV_4878331 [Trichonephila clavipes]
MPNSSSQMIPARRLSMVQEETGAPSEDATCVWMVADEGVGCTRAFVTMRRGLLDNYFAEGVLSLIFV